MSTGAIISRLASNQHGVVARRQLLESGLSATVIDRLIREEHLLPIHRGVFAAGFRPTDARAHLLAAALAGGPGALVSRVCAGFVLGVEETLPRGRIDVLVERGRCGSRMGIRFHRTRYLADVDRFEVDGIPVTSLARTLRDCAGVVSPQRLRKLFDEADRLHQLNRDALGEILERSNGHRGVKLLRGLLALHPDPPPLTRSPLEFRFFRLWERTGLKMPEFNAKIRGYEVDCVWRTERLIVELDGRSFHETAMARQRDSAKDSALAAAGYLVRRYTYREVFDRPEWVIDQLRADLRNRGGRHPPP
jgi:hypothetical protein